MDKTPAERSWEADRKTRKNWGELRPTTRVIPNKRKIQKSDIKERKKNMWYNLEKKEYLSDNEMERKIYEWWEDHYTEDDFENDLNDCNEDVTVCGTEYSQGFVFRRVDPVAFHCSYLDELDFLAREDIRTMNSIFWKDDWCLGDEIQANMNEYIWKEHKE